MIQKQANTGRIETYSFSSSILGNQRRVYVYTPPEYATSGKAFGLLLVFDGQAYLSLVPTPTILDNLIERSTIPPLVAVFLDSLGREIRRRELPCHQPFVEFLLQELLPWLHSRYHVTENPAQTLVAGSSYGGLAAAFIALRAPHRFGKILSQSGSFWWNRDSESSIPQEWLTQQFIARPRLPLHFYLEIGLKDSADMITSNRHLRDVLISKAYQVDYSEFHGGHDYMCWKESFAQGLLKLIGLAQE